MNLVEMLQLKFPEASFMPRGDINIGDEGDGILFILKWNVPGTPRPDNAQISEWMKQGYP